VFLGRSPERLVRRDANGIHTHALAGTPMAGSDPAKLKREHDVVVASIKASLATLGLAATTQADANRRAGNVEHLETRIEANGEAHLLALAGALHPTPAVGAAPRDAIHLLSRLDALERGWYAGAVGFMDDQGRGELAVALRSALVVPGASWMFAGAGIVAGSDPESEWLETEAKLQTMREALHAGPARASRLPEPPSHFGVEAP
jgi:salicylate biosynthesis isochorismate synthase